MSGVDTSHGAAAEDVAAKTLQVLDANASLLEKAVHLKETRLLAGRLTRQTAVVRKALSASVLESFVSHHLPDGLPSRTALLTSLKMVSRPSGRSGVSQARSLAHDCCSTDLQIIARSSRPFFDCMHSQVLFDFRAEGLMSKNGNERLYPGNK